MHAIKHWHLLTKFGHFVEMRMFTATTNFQLHVYCRIDQSKHWTRKIKTNIISNSESLNFIFIIYQEGSLIEGLIEKWVKIKIVYGVK